MQVHRQLELDSVVSILEIDCHSHCLFFSLESFVHVICKCSCTFPCAFSWSDPPPPPPPMICRKYLPLLQVSGEFRGWQQCVPWGSQRCSALWGCCIHSASGGFSMVWEYLLRICRSSLREYSLCRSFLGRYVHRSALSSSVRFLVSEYRILSRPCAVSFPLFRRVWLNSYYVNLSSRPLCAHVLLRSLSICFISSQLFWLLCCMNRPRKAWPFSSLVFSLDLLASSRSGVSFGPNIALHFLGRIVDVFLALSSSRKLFHLASFSSPAVCLNCLVLVFIAALSFLSGFGRVLPFCQFLSGAPFIVHAFSISQSHHGGCFLLFRDP